MKDEEGNMMTSEELERKMAEKKAVEAMLKGRERAFG